MGKFHDPRFTCISIQVNFEPIYPVRPDKNLLHPKVSHASLNAVQQACLTNFICRPTKSLSPNVLFNDSWLEISS